MKEIIFNALDTATRSGASYADLRVVESESESIGTKNGALASLRTTAAFGAGVRALVDGAWGFASGTDVTRDGLNALAKEAVAIARASALLSFAPVELADVDKHVDSWKAPVGEDPFKVAVEEKVATLLRVDRILRKRKAIAVARGSMRFTKERKTFASTIGSYIEQERTTTGVGYAATAVGDGDAQTRSYPNTFGGQHSVGGFELVRALPLVEEAERVAAEAEGLLRADPCPAGTYDLILDSSQLALQVHESCGHPIELDRVLGAEANYAGKSFLTTEKLGRYQFGSAAVTITADATAKGGLGTYAYDDEGVPATKSDLVRDGVLVGYLTSRETAPVVGLARSNGSMRASSYNRIPLIRMNNVSLAPGSGTLNELIGQTERGIYMETNRSWSIDNLRYNFQFGCEIAWEIADGRRVRMLKDPIYSGITPQFWRSCDKVCGEEEWVLWGTPNCGKGHPGQSMGTGHGAAPARFRGVRIVGK